MIEWIEKLPPPLLGLAGIGALWLGFNYAVLADRAIARDQASVAMPRCLEVLDRHALANHLRPSGFGSIFGLPHFDRIEREIIDRYRPTPLSAAEKQSLCACAATRAAAKLRWDYAVHTASFRLLAPESIAAATDEASTIVLTGVCGVLPKLRIGE